MKRIILFLTCLVLLSTAVFAGTDTVITVDQLPKKAQQFISKHFSGVEVSYAKMETELFDKSYDIIFVNGCKIEFDKHGDWVEVDCKYSEVPAGIVPQEIQKFITDKHPNAKVIGMDKDSKAYDLKLSNRVELKFDLKGNFIGYDD